MSRFEIASRLRELRENRNLKQDDIAQFLGTTVQKVSSFETGRTRIDIDTLVALSKYYNVDVNWILNIAPEKESLCLQSTEVNLILQYRCLNPEGQEKMIDYATDLVASGRYIKNGPDGLVEAK